MSILTTLEDWANKNLKDIINLGAESYEAKVNRITIKAVLVALFVLFIAFLLWRKIK
jgi:hypothetical protein